MEAREHPDVSTSTRFPTSFSPKGSLTFPPGFLPLQQTLDALPSHLLVPFRRPVPPSNLLCKIARGPADGPHSQHATRVKIIELAPRRASDSIPIAGIAEESCGDEKPHEVSGHPAASIVERVRNANSVWDLSTKPTSTRGTISKSIDRSVER